MSTSFGTGSTFLRQIRVRRPCQTREEVADPILTLDLAVSRHFHDYLGKRISL